MYAYKQLIIFLNLLIISGNSFSEQIPHWHDPLYIEKSFYDIALKNEYVKGQTRVRKWAKPLKVYISHQVGDNKLHLKILKMHLSHLSNITRLPIQYVEKKYQANLKVFITQSNKVDHIISSEISPKAVKQLRNAVCLANIRQNNRSEITHALVVIPVDRARMHGKLISCFVEELTQILGLPNDSKIIHPTIFSDRNVYKLLTGLDYLLLKILYSANIKAGMTQSEVKPKIKKIIQGWKKDNTIKNAHKEVRKGELYQLMGFR